MSLTLLQLVDQASGELGLAQPASVIGNPTAQTIQLLALSQRLGKDLVREFEWNRLIKTYVFTTTAALSTTGDFGVAATAITGIPVTTSISEFDVVSGTGIAPYSQVTGVGMSNVTIDMPTTNSTPSTSISLTFAKQYYNLPTDYDRQVSGTFWDRTNHWRNLGAKSSQAMATLRGGVISVGPRERFRVSNGKLQYFPAPTAALNQSFDYVSNNWVCVNGSESTSKSSFTLDTDFCIFPDDLMLSGLKYYFLRAKKLDYGVELADFSDILSTRKAQDEPAPTLNLSPVDYPMLVGPWSVQDGNWPTT